MSVLANLVRRFTAWNMKVCEAMERRLPRFFDQKLADTTYFPAVRARIQPYLDDGNVRVLEVGGIDRPLIERSERYTYAGLDIDEADRCYEVYDEFVVQSVEKPIDGLYDVIFSVTVLEHVPDNRAAVTSMFDAGGPGSASIHYVPSMGHPYALILRAVGNRMQRRLLSLIQEGEKELGGYPTHFDHCTASSMERLFRRAGYDRVEVEPIYSPTRYFRAFVPAHILMTCWMHLCRLLNLRYFASGFVVSGYKASPATA
jgi:hypothetical protein